MYIILLLFFSINCFSNDYIGTITNIKGTANVVTDTKSTPANQYLALKLNQKIVTDKESVLEIALDDKSVIRMEPQTEVEIEQILQIEKTPKPKPTGIKIFKGRAVVSASPIGFKGVKFKITMPIGVAAIRGSIIMVDISSENSVCVFEGEGIVAKSEEEFEMEELITFLTEDYEVTVTEEKISQPKQIRKEFLEYKNAVLSDFRKRVEEIRKNFNEIKKKRLSYMQKKRQEYRDLLRKRLKR